MNDPLYLLADEPTGNLDTATEEEILCLLDDLHADGMTVIMVTHNPTMGERAERVVWLADGKIESDEATGK